MATSASTRTSHPTGERLAFPAYGPIEGLLSFGMFFVFVDRATPVVVSLGSERVLDLSPAVVRFGLASILWFVLLVTLIDQARRQLAALGLVSQGESRLGLWSRVTPASLRTTGYLVALTVGGTVAAITVASAIETGVALIPVIVTADVAAFDLLGFLEMVLFFVAYGFATHALDRLLIDGVRTLRSE